MDFSLDQKLDNVKDELASFKKITKEYKQLTELYKQTLADIEDVVTYAIPFVRDTEHDEIYKYPVLEAIIYSYISKGDFKNAAMFISKLEKLEGIVDREIREQMKAVIYRLKADFYLNKNPLEIDAVYGYIKEAVRIYELHRENFLYLHFEMYLLKTEGDIDASQKRYTEAIESHTKALDLAIQHGNAGMQAALYKQLSSHHEKINNFKLALNYYKKYELINGRWYDKGNLAYIEALYGNASIEKEEKQIGYHMALKELLGKKGNLDTFTKIGNRKYLNHVLYYKSINEKYIVYPISVLMMDVAGVKNDSDSIVKIVSDAITSACKRAGDVVVRYSENRFVVMLEGTGEKGAKIVTTTILKNIEQLNSVDVGEVASVNVGIATLEGDQVHSYDSLISEADKALCISKEKGQNEWMHIEDILVSIDGQKKV